MNALVYRGVWKKTRGGLTRDHLIRNKRGRIVSKRVQAQSKRKYKHLEPWTKAKSEACKMLGITGFVAINGETLIGKALYWKTKALRDANVARKAASAAG